MGGLGGEGREGKGREAGGGTEDSSFCGGVVCAVGGFSVGSAGVGGGVGEVVVVGHGSLGE